MSINTITKISRIIEPIIKILGYELWGCEVQQQGKKVLLRVYIDSPRGININDCSKVSYEIEAILNVEDPIAGSYALEVSSPGIARPLFRKEHYERFVGKIIKLHLYAPYNRRRNYIGQIKEVIDNVLYIIIDGETLVIPIANIAKANLVAEF